MGENNLPIACSNRLLSDQPLVLHNWDAPRFPVVIGIPHAGRLYPRSLLDNLLVPPEALMTLEDRLVDALAQPLIELGYPVIAARAPRAWIDCNRDPAEVDRQIAPDLPGGYRPSTAKLRAGLGLIPTRLARHGPLWEQPIGWVETARRISQFHQPYHAKLARQLARVRERFGTALLFDLHSMPPLDKERDGRRHRIVVGSLYGESSDPLYVDTILARSRAAGLGGQADRPYPGGFVLATHASPVRSIHGVQVEIDRTTYLDDQSLALGAGARFVRRWVTETVQELTEMLWGRELLAAE